MSGYRSKNFEGAYQKGKSAFCDGIKRKDNPYPDFRTKRGCNGWQDAKRLKNKLP
jgi:hypothetical protein